MFQKGVHIQSGRFFFPSKLVIYVTKMLTEDEVLLHLEMRFQLGVLRHLDIRVKEIQTYKHFLTVHFTL